MARYTGKKFQESVIWDQMAAAANAVQQQNILTGLGNNVTRNPNYVEPEGPAAPLQIDNRFVDTKPSLLTERDPNGVYDENGYRLDTGPARDLGGGVTATAAVLPEGFQPAAQEVSRFSMPFPGQGLTDKQKQSANALTVSEQQRQKMSATWDVIKQRAAREQWTPAQIEDAAMQMQNKAAYQSVVNPVTQAETEEDINDPVVAISRMREKNPELAQFLQLDDKGKIEVIPGIVPMMEAMNKKNGVQSKEGVDLSSLKRKAIEGDFQMETDMLREKYNWPREEPAEDTSWIPGMGGAAREQYYKDKAGFAADQAELRSRYFGAPAQAAPAGAPAAAGAPSAPAAAPAAPQSATQVDPRAAQNPRLYAQENGIFFVPDAETGRRMRAEGKLKAGDPMVLPDGRVIPAP